MSDGVSVRGGADGIEARFDDMELTARTLAHAATTIDDVAHACLRSTGAFAGSGVFGPLTSSTAEYRRAGIAALQAGDLAQDVRSLATGMHAAIHLYRERDGSIAGRFADRIGGAISTVWHAGAELPRAAYDGAMGLLEDGPTAALERLLAADPATVDALNLAASLPLGSPLGSPLADLLAFLRSYLADGTPVVHAAGPDTGGAAARPPRNVHDLMTALARRDAGKAGEIDVRVVVDPAGHRHVVVDIPGTKDWSLSHETSNVVGAATNVRAIDGTVTAYETGVLEAMRDAGVRPDDDVMLVGHSLGGMIAVAAARDAVRSGAFRVSHVVTAGAPVGKFAAQLPKSVQLLALENRNDVVPHLDGRDNPASPNITTVTFDGPDDSTGDAHGIESSYAPGAARVDASDDPAIRRFLGSAGGFLDGTAVRTDTFVITRSYH